MCLLKKKFPNSVEQNVVRCRNESSFRSCFATVCNYYLSRPIWKRGTFLCDPAHFKITKCTFSSARIRFCVFVALNPLAVISSQNKWLQWTDVGKNPFEKFHINRILRTQRRNNINSVRQTNRMAQISVHHYKFRAFFKRLLYSPRVGSNFPFYSFSLKARTRAYVPLQWGNK